MSPYVKYPYNHTIFIVMGYGDECTLQRQECRCQSGGKGTKGTKGQPVMYVISLSETVRVLRIRSVSMVPRFAIRLINIVRSLGSYLTWFPSISIGHKMSWTPKIACLHNNKRFCLFSFLTNVLISLDTGLHHPIGSIQKVWAEPHKTRCLIVCDTYSF
jgi:hypothetical protein